MLKNQIFVKFLDKFTVMPKVLICNSFKRKWGSQRGELIIKSWELKGIVQQDHTRKLFGSNYRDQLKNKKNQ